MTCTNDTRVDGTVVIPSDLTVYIEQSVRWTISSAAEHLSDNANDPDEFDKRLDELLNRIDRLAAVRRGQAIGADLAVMHAIDAATELADMAKDDVETLYLEPEKLDAADADAIGASITERLHAAQTLRRFAALYETNDESR